jgi:tetratricopeptide (TPR) repeat protein
MMVHLQYDNRQVLPRWFLYHAFREIPGGYRTDPRKPADSERRQLETAIANWRKRKSLSLAIELIAAAEIGGEPEAGPAKEAVSFIRSAQSSEAGNPLLSKLLALFDMDSADEKDEPCVPHVDAAPNDGRSQIAAARRRLIVQPRDAIGWIDLAFLYTIRGLPSKARRCVEIASALSQGNRQIQRFAARFYVHVGEPDHALALIRASPTIRRDPFLIASEIAISEAFELKSKFVSDGRRLIETAHYRMDELNELYAALSTMEFWAGNGKKAKKLLRSALSAPNENTLAQAEFLDNRFDFPFDPSEYDAPCKHEALSWDMFFKSEYEQSLTQARQWYQFQPFASRPAVLSSYISAVIFGDDKGAILDLKAALKVSPHDTDLINNYVFSLARLGKIEEAQKALSMLSRRSIDPMDYAVLKATVGLLHFRMDKPGEGAALYESAIQYFSVKQDYSNLSRAYYFYGIEMLKIDASKARELLGEAEAISRKHGIRDVLFILERNKEIAASKPNRLSHL